jgi:hypothetical protein
MAAEFYHFSAEFFLKPAYPPIHLFIFFGRGQFFDVLIKLIALEVTLP